MSQSSLRGQGFGPLAVMQRDPRLASRYRYADALMQQGASTAPVSSPLEGLARALQAGVGGYLANSTETEAEGRSSAASKLLGEALSKYGTDPTGALQMLGENPDTADVASQSGLARALQKPEAETFGSPITERGADGNPIQVRYGNRGARQVVEGAAPFQNPRDNLFSVPGVGLVDISGATPRTVVAAQRETSNEPLVEVADPSSQTGRRLVTRSLAAGMAAPAPNAPQGTPQERAISVLSNPAIDPGSREYAQAYYLATLPQVTPNGVITPTLPDWVRPPAFQMPGAPGAAPQPAAPPAQPPAMAPPGPMPGAPMPQPAPQATPPQIPADATVMPPINGRRTFRMPNGQEVEQRLDGLYDLRTGQPVMQFGAQTEAAGAPPVAATLAPLETELTSMGERGKAAVPLVGNSLVSAPFQQAQQAGREFLAVVLRKDTGAAITNQEFEIYGPMYLPQPGDGPQVLEQKRLARDRVMQGIEAGLPRAAIERAPATASPRASAPAATGTPPAPPPGFQLVR